MIFDLDGTLVDTVNARIEGWLEALEAAEIRAARVDIAPMIGMDGRRLAREVAFAVGRDLTPDEVDATDRAAGEAFDRLNRRPRTLPGVHEAIAALDQAGIPWVVATSSRREQVAVSIKALGLAREPTIVDGSHVEHAKPAPDLLLLAASRMGVDPVGCWAVGDSTWDIRAAVAGGMTAVGVIEGSAVPGAELKEAGATMVIGSLVDLAELIILVGKPG
ncbi:MAG TPA: HAD family phosphatase [Candidatus Limnocylindrales bacterium]